MKRSQPEQSGREKEDPSSNSGEVVEKSVGGITLDREKVVEESATSVSEEVAKSGNKESTTVVE